MEKSTKKYHPDILSKDFTIAFFAGVAGGISVLLVSLIINFLMEGKLEMALRAFIAYILIGGILYYFFDWFLKRTYGKQRK